MPYVFSLLCLTYALYELNKFYSSCLCTTPAVKYVLQELYIYTDVSVGNGAGPACCSTCSSAAAALAFFEASATAACISKTIVGERPTLAAAAARRSTGARCIQQRHNCWLHGPSGGRKRITILVGESLVVGRYIARTASESVHLDVLVDTDPGEDVVRPGVSTVHHVGGTLVHKVQRAKRGLAELVKKYTTVKQRAPALPSSSFPCRQRRRAETLRLLPRGSRKLRAPPHWTCSSPRN